MDRESVEGVLRRVGSTKLKWRPTHSRIQATCPLATWRHKKGTDREPSMSVLVSEEGTKVKCFGCNFLGTLASLVSSVAGYGGDKELVTLADQVAKAEKQDPEALAQQAKVKYGPPAAKKPTETHVSLVWDEKEIERYRGRTSPYVIGRGIPIEMCKEWEIGFDERGQRATFVVRSMSGQLVGVMGRSVIGEEPKWMAYLRFSKGEYLYGEHKLDLTKGQVTLVEGPIDALVWRMYGIPNVVASMNAHMTTTQIRRIRDWGVDVYLAFDADKGGNDGKELARQILGGRVRLFDVILPAGKDPDEMTKEDSLRLHADARLVV